MLPLLRTAMGGRRPPSGPRRWRWRALILALLLPAAACAPQAPPATALPAPGPAGPRPQVLPAGPPKQRVALLLPLSGGDRTLGQAMLNAAQLALFDQGDPRVEFLPRDTRGSAAGAAEAARGAIAEGARAMAGPLTLSETAAAAGAAQGAGAPVFAFTSDAAQAQPGVWVLGLTPAEQAERMAEVAAAAGARSFGVLVPEGEFGRRLALAFRQRLALLGLPAPVEVTHGAQPELVVQAARALALRAGPEGMDVVLLGQSGALARTAASSLAGMLPRPARLMGTALWVEDRSLGQEPALAGSWFPGPDPAARQRFEQRYAQVFGRRPPARTGLAYDGAALAARTVRDGAGAALAPVGEALMGADGPIRLLPDGQARRGLAIFALDPSGEPVVLEAAPLPPGGRPGA